MKFIPISDTHGYHRELVLPEGDVIIHAGDFCHYGSDDDLYDFLDWYKELNYEYKILIGGNHDFLADRDTVKFHSILPEKIIYLEDAGVEINSIKIWGSPVHPDPIDWAFGRKRGLEMKKHWDLIPEDIDILITHTPPYGILDKVRAGKSFGCEELRKRIKDLNIKYHVFGHIHASYGEELIGDTQFINASVIKPGKGLVNKPIEFEFTE